MNAEIKIVIKDKNVEIISNIEHDDVIMFFFIEAIFQLRNKQYEKFLKK